MSIRFHHDAAGALTRIRDQNGAEVAAFAYDSAGRPQRRGVAGAAETYEYDVVSRLSSLTHDLAGTASDHALTFEYNPASQIVKRTRTNDAFAFPLASVSRTYAVNGLNQHTRCLWSADAERGTRRAPQSRAVHRIQVMQVNWRIRFEQSQIDKQDCPRLLNDIEKAADNEWKFAELVYYYGYTCPQHPKVVALCETYLKKPIPGVTATCLKVLVDYWCLWERYVVALAAYLDSDKYDEWCDEVIFSANWVSRNLDLPLPSALTDRLMVLKTDPRVRALGFLD